MDDHDCMKLIQRRWVNFGRYSRIFQDREMERSPFLHMRLSFCILCTTCISVFYKCILMFGFLLEIGVVKNLTTPALGMPEYPISWRPVQSYDMMAWLERKHKTKGLTWHRLKSLEGSWKWWGKLFVPSERWASRGS